jgi:hypothetical protein
VPLALLLQPRVRHLQLGEALLCALPQLPLPFDLLLRKERLRGGAPRYQQLGMQPLKLGRRAACQLAAQIVSLSLHGLKVVRGEQRSVSWWW